MSFHAHNWMETYVNSTCRPNKRPIWDPTCPLPTLGERNFKWITLFHVFPRREAHESCLGAQKGGLQGGGHNFMLTKFICFFIPLLLMTLTLLWTLGCYPRKPPIVGAGACGIWGHREETQRPLHETMHLAEAQLVRHAPGGSMPS